jgi:hypothetical protein
MLELVYINNDRKNGGVTQVQEQNHSGTNSCCSMNDRLEQSQYVITDREQKGSYMIMCIKVYQNVKPEIICGGRYVIEESFIMEPL